MFIYVKLSLPRGCQGAALVSTDHFTAFLGGVSSPHAKLAT